MAKSIGHCAITCHHEGQLVFAKAAAKAGRLTRIAIVLRMLDSLHHFGSNANLHGDANLFEIAGCQLIQFKVRCGIQFDFELKAVFITGLFQQFLGLLRVISKLFRQLFRPILGSRPGQTGIPQTGNNHVTIVTEEDICSLKIDSILHCLTDTQIRERLLADLKRNGRRRAGGVAIEIADIGCGQLSQLVARQNTLAVLAEPVQRVCHSLRQNVGRVSNVNQCDLVDVRKLIVWITLVMAIILFVLYKGHRVILNIFRQDIGAGALCILPSLRAGIPFCAADIDLSVHQCLQLDVSSHAIREGKDHSAVVRGFHACQHCQCIRPVELGFHLFDAIDAEQTAVRPDNVSSSQGTTIVRLAILEKDTITQLYGQSACVLIKFPAVSQLTGHILQGNSACVKGIGFGVIQTPVHYPKGFIPERKLVFVHHGRIKIIVELWIIECNLSTVLWFGAGGFMGSGALVAVRTAGR